MENADLKSLEKRLEDLLREYAHLQEENRALRQQQSHLMAERASLIERSELARSRVESMITRLKSMEM